jgi:histidinol-phosphatase (PHP family)
MLVSYHTHTLWSDGSANATDMLTAAANAGLSEIGISDHYVMTPFEPEGWSMPLDFLPEYTCQLKKIAEANNPIDLKIGIEADYFPQTIHALTLELLKYDFDYIIGSIHILDGFHVDETASLWLDKSQEDINNIWRNYYLNMVKLAESNLFDIVGHFDLCKKFAFYPTIDLSVEIDASLEAISKSGMSIEINTAGWDKPASSAYPELDILINARCKNIPIVISADAHAPGEINRHYAKAVKLAKEAGYTEHITYQKRKKIFSPLPEQYE